LQLWLKKQYDLGHIISYSNAVYEREINRYGGIKLIKYAEKVFESDSLCAFFIVRLIDEVSEISLLNICLIFIYDLLKIFLGDKVEIEKYLDKYVSKEEFRKEYQKNRKNHIAILEDPYSYLSSLDDQLINYFKIRNVALSQYYENMKIIDENNKLTNTISRITMTFVHMFCNRINGNRIWERQLLALTRHTVHDCIKKERRVVI
ncbi:MAG: thiopeptide-type bacteriocin biosynthesis protein, partial [Bacteroidia bacterium]|nr:thiopeptide-type bacteriocin biosynthesis protein [Bacteroidia bacterium]